MAAAAWVGPRRRRRARSVALAVALVLPVLAGVPARSAAVGLAGVPDSYAVVHDRTLGVAAPGVLGNDLGIGGGTKAILDSPTSNGSLNLNSDGGFSYTPKVGFVGTDTFRYHPSGLLVVVPTTVTIQVVNTAPVAVADTASATAGVELLVRSPGVLANDVDANGDPMTARLESGPAHGTLRLDSDGEFRYTADAGYTGLDSFSYRAGDGVSWSAPAVVTITVTKPPSSTPLPSAIPTLPPLASPTPPPTPSPRPTAGPTATPTPTPGPSVTPTPGPSETPDPTSRPTATPAPTAAPTRPTPSGPPPSGLGIGGIGGPVGGPPGEAPAAPGASPGAAGNAPGSGEARRPVSHTTIDPFEVLFDGELGLGSLSWAVPAIALGLPGLLIILLTILAQTAAGLVWIPIVRRSLGQRERGARAHAGTLLSSPTERWQSGRLRRS